MYAYHAIFAALRSNTPRLLAENAILIFAMIAVAWTSLPLMRLRRLGTCKAQMLFLVKHVAW